MVGSKQRYYWLGSEKTTEQDTFFLEALDAKQWSAGSSEKWDTCWNTSMPSRSLFNQLDASKTINHIPGNNALTIKSKLNETLTKAKQLVSGQLQEQRYDFFPDTYSMPEDYFEFQAIAAENPDWLWIQKPKNLSRGRGIEVVKHPETVPLDSEWIIQRYLSEPHLWDGYKYVLRCYVLITSVEPLRFYWYHEGFAKLTSEPYSNEDLDNPYRHLTNPDINEDNEEVDTPVVFHSFQTYRQWLKDQGADDEKLFADLHDLIALTVIAARESLRTQSQNIEADTQGAYELIGLDCMVDSDLKPWILECNLSPSLETCSTGERGKEEGSIKRQLVKDIVNMLGLNDLDTKNSLTEQQNALYEREHLGGFQCVFPTEDANEYLNCFPVPRYADISCLPESVNVDYSKIPLQVKEGVEAVFADSLALLCESKNNGLSKGDRQFIVPNELATLIWLNNSEGMLPDEIANDLDEVDSQNSTDSISQNRLTEVWDVLADWSQANLLTGDLVNTLDPAERNLSTKQHHWLSTFRIKYAGVTLNVRCSCPIAARYIQPLSCDLTSTNDQEDWINVDILRSQYGYVLINEANLIAGSRKLSLLVHELLTVIAKQCLSPSDIAVVQGVVLSVNDHNFLIMSDSHDIDERMNNLAVNHSDVDLLSGSPVLAAEKNMALMSDMPLWLSEKQKGLAKEGAESLMIAEKYGKAYRVSPNNAIVKQKVKIDALMFLDKNVKSPQMLRSAENITKLWKKCINQQPSASSLLPMWLDSLPGIKIDESVEEVALLELMKAFN